MVSCVVGVQFKNCFKAMKKQLKKQLQLKILSIRRIGRTTIFAGAKLWLRCARKSDRDRESRVHVVHSINKRGRWRREGGVVQVGEGS